MSDHHELPEDLLALLDEYCNNVIDDERLQELKAYLLADEAVRREFVAYFHLHTEMQFAVRARKAAAAVLDMIDDGSRPRPRASRRWGWWVATAAAVVVVGLGALLGPKGRREAPVASSPLPSPSRPKVGIASGLAMIIKLDDVRWEPADGPHPLEGDLLASGHFRFRSGRATLSMLSGVVLVVEGPADVELIAHDKVVCRRGRLRARVPEGAEGFVVSGPGSAVVDMGTEFGLNIESDGKTRGKVFEGKVEAAVLNEAGAYRRSQMMDRGSNTFKIDPGSGRIEADTGPGSFVTPSKLAAQPLVLDAGYRDAILPAGPWGYWRFDSVSDGNIPNEVPDRPPLHVTGPIHLSSPSRGNTVAVFGDGETGQCLALDGPWEPARRPGFAVEFWFLPEAIGHSALASMFVDDPLTRPGEKSSSLQFHFLLELTSSIRTKYRLHQPASVRLLHRFPAGWFNGDNLYSNEPYIPYRWHHLVGQMNGDRMELFLDGNPTPSLTVDPGYSNKPSRLLLGRLTAIPKHDDDTSRPFVGRMDEVALYDRPLTVEEVRHHYRLADLQARPD